MTPDAKLRMDVYQEGQRAHGSGAICPYTDWRRGTWNKGWQAAADFAAAQRVEALKPVPTKQPEAMRLADAIDPMVRDGLDNLTCAVAADMLRTQHALLVQARDSIEELVPDPQCDFGPAYAGADRRRDEVLAALNKHLDQP